MKIRLEKFSISTDGTGAWSETRKIPSGYLLQYRLVYVDTDTGADLDMVGATTGFVYINQDNLGIASFQRLPRYATADETGTASLYAGSGEPVEGLVAISENENVTVSIANGGASKTGTLYLWILQVE